MGLIENLGNRPYKARHLSFAPNINTWKSIDEKIDINKAKLNECSQIKKSRRYSKCELRVKGSWFGKLNLLLHITDRTSQSFKAFHGLVICTANVY